MAGNRNSGNRTASNPYTQRQASSVDRDENANSLAYLLSLKALPKCDLSDAEAVDARTTEFFQLCAEHGMKPLITSYAMALGIDRTTLFRLREGYSQIVRNVTPQTLETIKNGCTLIEANMENLLINAKAGQVGLIFGLKQFGWKDQVEHINATPDKKQYLEGATREEIAAKYAAMVGVEYKELPGVAEPPAVYEVPIEED